MTEPTFVTEAVCPHCESTIAEPKVLFGTGSHSGSADATQAGGISGSEYATASLRVCPECERILG